MSDERIARLEAMTESDRKTLDDVSDKLDSVALDVQAIKLHVEKQKGFLAGCMFVLLPIWSAVTIFVQSVWERITAGHDI